MLVSEGGEGSFKASRGVSEKRKRRDDYMGAKILRRLDDFRIRNEIAKSACHTQASTSSSPSVLPHSHPAHTTPTKNMTDRKYPSSLHRTEPS